MNKDSVEQKLDLIEQRHPGTYYRLVQYCRSRDTDVLRQKDYERLKYYGFASTAFTGYYLLLEVNMDKILEILGEDEETLREAAHRAYQEYPEQFRSMQGLLRSVGIVNESLGRLFSFYHLTYPMGEKAEVYGVHIAAREVIRNMDTTLQ